MANRPPVIKHRAADSTGISLVIYGPTSLLTQYFSNQALEVVAAVTPSQNTSQVNLHGRRRFPGGPVSTVSPHNRTGLPRSGSGGGAKPGNKFWCERIVDDGANDKVVARQFTYEGSWTDLKTFAQAARTGAAFKLRNHSGRAETVELIGED